MVEIIGHTQKSPINGFSKMPAKLRQIWRTNDVTQHEGFDYFCDAVCEAFMELTPSRTSSKDFSATVESLELANGRLNKVQGTSHSVKRTRSQISRVTDPCFYLNLQLHSQCVINQEEHQIVLKQGQLALFDGTKPFEIHHPQDDNMALASLQIPLKVVETVAQTYKISMAKLGGIRVSDHPSVGPLAVTAMRTLSDRSSTMSAIDVQVLLNSLVDFSVTACALNGEGTNREEMVARPLLLIAIMDFIDQNLGHPELSMDSVSSQFGVTPRYVHKLFKNTEQSFSQHILECRLDRAMINLRNPENAKRTISEIAFGTGFSDLSNFNRRFKERFGKTPKEARRG